MNKLLIFLALILSVVGCSNGNSYNHNPLNTTQSREIAKITNKYYVDQECVATRSTTFTYDILKRISSISDECQKDYDNTYLIEQYITYLADKSIKLIEFEYKDDKELSTTEITMTVGINGCISELEGESHSYYDDYEYTDEWHTYYSYSDLDYLYSGSVNGEINQSYTWKNGNLITLKETRTYNDYKSVLHVGYNNKVAPNINIDISKCILLYLMDYRVHAPVTSLYNNCIGCTDLFGMKNNNFITNIEYKDYAWADFSWTYDIYGFPTKCISSLYDEGGYCFQVISEFEYL